MEGKRDYYEDIQLFESNFVLGWSVAFLLFLFTLNFKIGKKITYRELDELVDRYSETLGCGRRSYP